MVGNVSVSNVSLRRGVKPKSGRKNVAILDLSGAISRKRCKIGGKLLLITNRKSHGLSIGTKLGDLE